MGLGSHQGDCGVALLRVEEKYPMKQSNAGPECVHGDHLALWPGKWFIQCL